MAEGPQSRRLSLDTNVLLNLAAEYQFAVDFKEEFQRRKYALQVVPGVMAELNALALRGNDEQRGRAAIALDNLLRWGITPIILTDVEMTYRKNFMSIVEERRILPSKEVNDARILADTGIAQVPLLVTSDRGILDADQIALSLAFEDAGLCVVKPAHPARLAKLYKRSR
jgi:hypothetical protein